MTDQQAQDAANYLKELVLHGDSDENIRQGKKTFYRLRYEP